MFRFYIDYSKYIGQNDGYVENKNVKSCTDVTLTGNTLKFFPKYYKKNEVIDTSPSQLIFLCNSSGSRPRLSTKNLSYTELSHAYVSLPQRLSTRTIAILIQRKFQNLCQRRCMLYRINQSYETSRWLLTCATSLIPKNRNRNRKR